MFTSEYPTENQPRMVKTYQGVDLSNQTCYKLQMNQLYKQYAKDDIHYAVSAIQKGFKPYTKVGLKRIKRKNEKKQPNKKGRFNKTIKITKITKLVPQSPQAICMKALRTEFLSNFKTHVQVSNKTNDRDQKMLERKLNQRKRRNELIRLVKIYKQHLTPHFSHRLIGYGKCPKVSRKEIIDYLLTKGIVADIGPQKFDPKKTPYCKEGNFLEEQSNEIDELNNKIDNVLKVNLTPVVREQDFPSLLN